MQSDDDRITFDISYALRLTTLRPRRRTATDNDRDRVLAAQTIIEHLKLCGWRFWKGRPGPPHSAG